jgi:outer membrane protein assembly factor BamB
MRSFFSIALTLAISASAGADDWSMYLRNTAHTSFNASESQVDKTNVRSLTPAWTYSRPGWLIASAVTVDQGVAYFGDWKGYFHAVRAADGTELWSQYVGLSHPGETMECSPALGVTSQATLAGDVVYVGGGDSAVYALDRDSGQQLWKTQLADPQSGSYLWSSIMVSQNALYIGVASLADCPLVRGGIVRIRLDAPDQPLIRYLVPKDEQGGGVWSTPAIDEATNTVFVTTGTGDQDADRGVWGGTMLALDATTLNIKAHYFLPTNSLDDDIEWGSSPTLFETPDGTRLVGATGKDGNLYALSRDDLSLVWTTRLAVSCICPECGCGSLSTPSFDGNMLYVGAGVDDPNGFDSGSIYAITPSTGEVVWKQGLDGTVIAPTTVANGVVYVASMTGLLAFDAQTGELLWRDGAQTISFAQPVIVDGTLYGTYLKGDVVAWQVPAGSSSARIARPR